MRSRVTSISCAIAVAVTAFAGNALAQDHSAIEKLVRMNQKALGDYAAFEWTSARQTLFDALLVGQKARVDDHPVMARTYLNLGAVYLTGFKDRGKALKCFASALEIDPVTQPSGSIATEDVKAAFAEAKRTRKPRPRWSPGDDPEEKDLPVRILALDCPNEDEAIIDRPVTRRCALSPKLKEVANVFLMYRQRSKETYVEVQMIRSPKGWYYGKIPKQAMTGKSIAYYYEGRSAAGKLMVTNGDKDSPNFILLMDEDAYGEMKERQRFPPTLEDRRRPLGWRSR